VDDHDEGVTPRTVDFTVGTHTLEFRKEGYATGSTPVEITQDELPGAVSASNSEDYPGTPWSCEMEPCCSAMWFPSP